MMNDKLKQMEQVRDKSKDWVFPRNSTKDHLLDIRRTFKAIIDKAGISNLTIHDMHRSFASILINKGIPLTLSTNLLNPADIRTMQVYARLNTTSLVNASEAAGKDLEKFMARAGVRTSPPNPNGLGAIRVNDSKLS